MTRIIAGVAGGRRIETPKGADTRPTSDRVREALFGALDARGALDGAAVLDLFAGSGALGLEAASRGARSVVLVESGREATAVARRNAATLGLDGVRVVQAPVQRYLATATHAPLDPPADVVLLDPPYGFGEAELERRPGGRGRRHARARRARGGGARRARPRTGVAGGLGRRGRTSLRRDGPLVGHC